MEFSTNNVYSVLQELRGRPYIPVENQKLYKWASLLPDDVSEMDPDVIYICKLTEGLLRNHKEPFCHFVCIADRYLSEEELEDNYLLKNIIIIEEHRSVSWMLNRIQSRFRELEKWERELNDCVLQGGSYQDLFDISEKYLKNSLFALDSAYRLIANSKTYLSTDAINISLYEKGYYAPEIIEKFAEKRRFEEYHLSEGMTKNKPGVVAQFESFSQWCKYGGIELVQIVEVFSHHPVSPDSEELFAMLMKYIEICFQKEQKENMFSEFAYTRLLRDMLYGTINDIEQINKYAKSVGIPVSGIFDVYSIAFKDFDNMLLGRLIIEISQILPEARIVAGRKSIVILNYYKKGGIENSSKLNISKLNSFIEQNDAICGVSAPFASLQDYAMANKQAEYAIEYYMKDGDPLKEDDEKKERVVYYKDVTLFHMVDSASKVQFDAFHNNPYTMMLNTLMEYDNSYGTELYKILFSYLYNERRATDTGTMLHMHRNTVMYHVQHITDMLGIDLDDYYTRQGLLLSYHFKKIKDN